MIRNEGIMKLLRVFIGFLVVYFNFNNLSFDSSSQNSLVFAKVKKCKFKQVVIKKKKKSSFKSAVLKSRKNGYKRAVAYLPQDKPAAIVVDYHTGKVLYQHNSLAARKPASLTKMMTLYVLFHELIKGRVSFNERIVFSKKATQQEPCKLGIRAGQSISVRQAIYALITGSCNDVAVAVAEHISGSMEEFCRKMNKQARALGMVKTQFFNASGLPHPVQHSTPYDMAILSRAIIQHFPKHYTLFASKEFKYKDRSIKNHNRLLGSFGEGIVVDGLKTGWTIASGYNIAVSASKNGRRVIAVVMGFPKRHSRDNYAKDIIKAAFKGSRSGFARNKIKMA